MGSVLVIGSFGGKNNLIGGQTIKTKNVYEALKRKHDVSLFDTDSVKVNKAYVFRLLVLLIRINMVYFVGGQASLKYLFPVVFLFSKFKRGKVVYVTVGGWLYDFLSTNHNFYTLLVKRIDSVLVQTDFLEEKLRALGLTNVRWIPNFRMTPGYQVKHGVDRDILRLVFMARIVNEKGIYLIFDFVKKYLSETKAFSKKITIDFYGPVDENDKNSFHLLVNNYSNTVSYKGVLSSADIYKILPSYDVLLLPTFHPGEGFPGSILDAYLCGVPVITTRWKQIPEFVEDGKTGFLIETDSEQLCEKVKFFSNNQLQLIEMKKNAFLKSDDYSAESGLKILEESMGLI